MLLSYVLLLLLAPLSVTAKLWGWPDSFTLHTVGSNEWGKWGIPTNPTICPGWDNWCSNQCVGVQRLDHRDWGPYPTTWQWAHIRKEGSAWVDFWRQGDSNTFNMYESNKDGRIQGQCQIVDFYKSWIPCGDRQLQIFLHCWQW